MIKLKNRPYPRWGERRKPHVFVRGLHLDIPLLVGLIILSLIGLGTIDVAFQQHELHALYFHTIMEVDNAC